MRRALLLLGVAALAVLSTGSVVSADSDSRVDASGDLLDPPTSVSSGSVDIVRATFGHSRGRLVHTVTTAGSVPDPRRSANVPMLLIEHPTTPNGTRECTFFIGRHEGRLGVFTCGYGDRVGSARITRTGSRTIRYEFAPKAIDNPSRYEWAAITRAQTRYARSADVDRLPDGDHNFHRHTLR